MAGRNIKWVYLGILSLIWGSSFILMKKALIGLTPYQMGALRIVFTTIFLSVVGIKSIKAIEKRDWKWIALSGFLGSFFPPFLFAVAQTEIDSAIASILNSLTPLNTLITGLFLFGIFITRRQVLGVVIGFLGTLLLIVKGAEFNSDQNYWYSGLILLSSIGYALNINILKKYLNHLSAMSMAVGNFVLIFLPSLVILVATGFFDTIWGSPEMQKALLYVLVLSLFGTAIAKVLFNEMIKVSSPVFAASVTYTMPLVAIFWGVLDGERLSFYQIIGGIVILVGVYLANRSAGK